MQASSVLHWLCDLEQVAQGFSNLLWLPVGWSAVSFSTCNLPSLSILCPGLIELSPAIITFTPLPRPCPVYSRICFFFALYLANSCIAFILEFKYSLQFSGGGRASVPGTTLPLKTHKYQNLWVFQSLAQNSMVFAFNLQISCYIFKIISKWLMTPSIIQVLCKLLKLVLRCLGINTRKKSLYICHIYTHYIHHMYLFIV